MALALLSLAPSAARAEVGVDGRWRQSSLREEFTVQQWLDTRCGPPPSSSTTGGGEIVSVRSEGDELAFVGAGRVYRSNQCYDPMPTLARESHSRDAGGTSWRTQCRTPPSDPRRAVLNTLVVLTTEARIDLVETGRYEITVESGRCIADVKRTRSFDRLPDDVPEATAAPPVPTPTPKAPDPPRPAGCGTPGEPTRLEVRPSKKLLRTGESFTFRPLVLDAKGCDTRLPTQWRLAPEAEDKGLAIDANGTVTVSPDAAEGTAELVATAAGKDARVVVEVVSPARYDDLLAQSGLNAAGESDEASTVAIASQSIGAGEGRVEDRSRERRLLFVAIIGGVLLALGALTIVLARRARRAKELLERAEERHEARVQEVLDRRRRREAEHAAQTRAHEESIAAARVVAAARAEAQGTDPALPYPAPAAMAQGQPASRGKICPRCGERFDGGADFCGKDGTQLVLLN